MTMRGLWKRFRETGEVVKNPVVSPRLQNLLAATVSLRVYQQVSVQVPLLPLLSPGNKTSKAPHGLLHVAILLLHIPNKTSQHSVSQVRCLAPGCTSGH